VEETHEHNEYGKNFKTNFTLSAERTKVNRNSDEEIGGNCENVTGHRT